MQKKCFLQLYDVLYKLALKVPCYDTNNDNKNQVSLSSHKLLVPVPIFPRIECLGNVPFVMSQSSPTCLGSKMWRGGPGAGTDDGWSVLVNHLIGGQIPIMGCAENMLLVKRPLKKNQSNVETKSVFAAPPHTHTLNDFVIMYILQVQFFQLKSQQGRMWPAGRGLSTGPSLGWVDRESQSDIPPQRGFKCVVKPLTVSSMCKAIHKPVVIWDLSASSIFFSPFNTWSFAPRSANVPCEIFNFLGF